MLIHVDSITSGRRAVFQAIYRLKPCEVEVPLPATGRDIEPRYALKWGVPDTEILVRIHGEDPGDARALAAEVSGTEVVAGHDLEIDAEVVSGVVHVYVADIDLEDVLP